MKIGRRDGLRASLQWTCQGSAQRGGCAQVLDLLGFMGAERERLLAVAAVGYRHCVDIMSTQWRRGFGLPLVWAGRWTGEGGCLISTLSGHRRKFRKEVMPVAVFSRLNW